MPIVEISDNELKVLKKLVGRIEEKEVIFIPPTVNEVKHYCGSKGYGVDANLFVAHYTSNGWKVGKNKMKSWKSAVSTWAGKAKAFKNETTKRNLSAPDRVKAENRKRAIARGEDPDDNTF